MMPYDTLKPIMDKVMREATTPVYYCIPREDGGTTMVCEYSLHGYALDMTAEAVSILGWGDLLWLAVELARRCYTARHW